MEWRYQHRVGNKIINKCLDPVILEEILEDIAAMWSSWDPWVCHRVMNCKPLIPIGHQNSVILAYLWTKENVNDGLIMMTFLMDKMSRPLSLHYLYLQNKGSGRGVLKPANPNYGGVGLVNWCVFYHDDNQTIDDDRLDCCHVPGRWGP